MESFPARNVSFLTMVDSCTEDCGIVPELEAGRCAKPSGPDGPCVTECGTETIRRLPDREIERHAFRKMGRARGAIGKKTNEPILTRLELSREKSV